MAAVLEHSSGADQAGTRSTYRRPQETASTPPEAPKPAALAGYPNAWRAGLVAVAAEGLNSDMYVRIASLWLMPRIRTQLPLWITVP